MKRIILPKFVFALFFALAQFFPITVTYAQNNNALHFDGADDQLYIGNSTLLNTPHITLQAWIKMDNVFGYYGVVTKRNCCDDLTTFQWSMQTSPDGRMSWAVNLGGPNLLATGDPDPVTLGAWINYTGTFDGNVICLYKNGILAGTSLPVSGSIVAMNWPFIIGARDGASDWFPGTIDEVRIWDRALTQQEILANINCHLNGNEPGLIAYYDFNQGIAGGNNAGVTTLPDLTSHGLNGSLQNFALSGNSSNWVASAFTDLSVSIITQPKDTLRTSGNSAGFIVSSTNNPVSYQWQTDSLGTFKNIFDGGQYIGTSDDTLIVNSVTANNNNQMFRCVVSSPGFCPDTSIAALLNVMGVVGLNLISFDAIKEDKKVSLQWTTENESNLSSYTIERSSDGKYFYSIGNVAPRNSSNAHSYNFIDANPFAGLNFYRLKIMETDGRYSYSPIRKIDFENINTISIYPNPSTGKFTIDFGRTFDSKPYLIVIRNSLSQKVFETKTLQQKLEINLNGIATKGIYFLEVSSEKHNNIGNGKIIIK